MLAWKTLLAENFALSLSPDKLVVKEVRVLEPRMKMVIAQDRSINLTKVMRNNASALPACCCTRRQMGSLSGGIAQPARRG